jgi:hypothetical protein
MKKISDYYGTLYVGIAMNVKTNDYYGTHMGCCNECKKTNDYYGILYVGIVMNVKNQRLLWDPYASIAYLKMALWKL